MNALYQTFWNCADRVYEWVFPDDEIVISDFGGSRSDRAGSFWTKMEEVCHRRIHVGYYQNDDLVAACMKLRKKGKEIVENLQGSEKPLIVLMDAACFRLIQLEKKLVEGSLAHGTALDFEGVHIEPMEPLLDVPLVVQERIEELVGQFEAVAYISGHLQLVYAGSFPNANFMEDVFSPCNQSVDSLAVVMRNRKYGYQLFRLLLRFERFDLMKRLEVALNYLVRVETHLNQFNQKLYETSFVKPAVRYELDDPKYKEYQDRLNQEKFAKEKFEVYLDRKIEPQGIQKFLRAYGLI